MKLKTRILSCIACLSLFLTTGCSVYDEARDCDPIYKVRFIYDWNMSGGDGFPSQVSSITLWVFDHTTGNLVAKYSDSGEALSKPGYLLELPGLTPGNYDFIAWGGLENSPSFTIPSNIYKETDLTCSLNIKERDGETFSDTHLQPLFYGSLNDLTVEDNRAEEKVFTVYLMKDTNNINLSLQHISDDLLDVDSFTIYMTDANANLDYDNSLLPSPMVYYYPWAKSSGFLDLSGEDLNYAQFEISSSRLMADRNPIITIIDNATGQTVYSIPIVEWAKELRSQQNMPMSDQEYLDREHEYTIMLYLIDREGEGGWQAASIIINGYEIL